MKVAITLIITTNYFGNYNAVFLVLLLFQHISLCLLICVATSAFKYQMLLI